MTQLFIFLSKKISHYSGIRFLLMAVFILLAGMSMAQTINVKGKVTDASTGEGIPGANVLLKGTTTGTVTNSDGTYLINAPSGGTLVFSFIGYKSSEVPVSGKTGINVNLEAEAIGLDEVVAIGYGTVKKIYLPGWVESLKA
jgi:hypothetical protein